MSKLTRDEVEKKLNELSGWKREEEKIVKEFELKDFQTALDFVVKTGAAAEDMNHHPDILIHSYNKVNISLTSHDAGGLTEKDFKLASVIENL